MDGTYFLPSFLSFFFFLHYFFLRVRSRLSGNPSSVQPVFPFVVLNLINIHFGVWVCVSKREKLHTKNIFTIILETNV